MQTLQWEHVRAGVGKYHVRLGGNLIPGLIIGGNGRWFIQVAGNQIPKKFETVGDAAEWLVIRHMGL